MEYKVFLIFSILEYVICRNIDPTLEKPKAFHINQFLKNNANTRIIGGENAVKGDAPYQCAILSTIDNPLGVYCGCSILNETTVITAGHCVKDLKPGFLKTAVVYNSLCIISGIGILSIKIDYTTLHPKYNATTAENDIALVTVKGKLTLNQIQANPIRLPDKEEDPMDGLIVTPSGWGLTESDGILQPLCLQKIDLPIFNRVECKSLYGDATDNINLVTDTMVCAGGFESGNKDICSGDSGGPLAKGHDKNAVLVGVVSKGTCGSPGAPGIYTRVDKYLDWIKYNITS